MNDKERLQKIKRKAMAFDQELREIDLEEHIDWLIEQAKKAERYENALKHILKNYHNEELDDTSYAIEVQQIAKEALEGME